MKRAISLLILMVVMWLFIQWGSSFLKKEHELTYEINSNNIIFEVFEKYQKDANNTYYLEIKNNNNTFIYSIPNNFNKQKKILKNIEFYEQNNTICIYPVFSQDVSTNIECNIDGKLYAYEAIKNRQEVTFFVSTLKEKGYSLPAWTEQSSEETKSATSYFYKDNLLTEDIITIWNYKGLDTISKDETHYYSLYSYDKYENTHGMLVGKYYVTPVYQNGRVYDFSELNIINVETKTTNKMSLDEHLNQDTYINGVVDGKLYYFDPDNLTQIEVNPNSKKERLVGTKDINAQFYNGNWATTNIYEFVNTKKVFELDYNTNEKLMSYNPTKIFESDSAYYYLKDGSFYQLNKMNLDTPILLFYSNDMKEIKIRQNTIYFIVGDTLYFYQDDYGIRKLVKNSEWNYNYTNIVDIYKKPNQ